MQPRRAFGSDMENGSAFIIVLLPHPGAQTVSRTWTVSRLGDAGSLRCPGARFIGPTRRAIKVQRPVRFASKAGCARHSSLEMSAIGPKQICPSDALMSAFGGKADMTFCGATCRLLTQSGRLTPRFRDQEISLLSFTGPSSPQTCSGFACA